MAGCCQCAGGGEARIDAPDREETGMWMRMVFAALVASQSMIFGLAVNLSPPEGTARLVLHAALALSAIVVFCLVGMPVWREAVGALLRGRIVMEQLFLAGILGAWFASLHCTFTGHGHVYYEVVAILLAIYTFGKLIGEKRREAAWEAARQLGEEFETAERILPDGSFHKVKVTELQPGDCVRVAMGGGVPVDGVVREGVALVRESAMTGEAFPVVRRAGDRILAGSHVLDNGLVVEATSSGSGRLLDDLLTRVREARGRTSRLEREADRLVRWFLPSVLLVALATFVGWTWAAGWMVGTFNALAVLVVACPCSMGLATPVGIWGAMSALARRGIVPRDSDFVEKLAAVDTVVFDKTGTLGEDQLELVDFVSASGSDRESLLEAVAAVENSSNHPIAIAFRRSGVTLAASEVRLIEGKGLAGTVAGAQWQIGNRLLVENADRESLDSLRTNLALATTEGCHEVWVLKDGNPVGLGILRERLRSSSHQAIQSLTTAGYRCIVMTGDRAEAAAAHGFAAEVFAGLVPAEKAERVASLESEGSRVLFVGDGINDAPAMAASTASLALSGGSALAQEASGGKIHGGDLSCIPYALLRCRRAVGAIRKNLLFAAVYNVIGISMAAAGLIHPVVAAMLMLISSFTVTWSALREVEMDEVKLRPVSRPRRRKGNRPAAFWERYALPGGIALQGLVVAWLGGFALPQALWIVLLFAAAAAAFHLLLSYRRLTPDAGMMLTMFSLGGLAMLAGWWADAGFAQVVRDGVCLCGCPKSNLGFGLVMQPTWMAAGMVFASVSGFYYEAGAGRSRLLCWLAGLFGMFVGMDGAALLMALVPVNAAAAHLQFFATYGVMMTGMCLGMLAGCLLYRKWTRGGKT